MNAAAVGAFIGGLLILLAIQYIVAAVFMIKPLRPRAMVGLYVGAALTLLVVVNQSATMGSYDLWAAWVIGSAFMFWRTRRRVARQSRSVS